MTKLFLLTGAGVSAESGLGTFRDQSGLWTQYDLRQVATPEGYAENPAHVLDFYNMRRRNALGAEPNAAHAALAELGRALGDDLFLCTQNVDDLHERAGSPQVCHMHGELIRVRCSACEAGAHWRVDLTLNDSCAACGAVGRMRPDIVWFGEMPMHMDLIHDRLTNCDVFVAIGTSASVYPAAGFVELARRMRAKTVELNLEPSERAGDFDEALYGPATEIVPAWVAAVLAGRV